jgi:hypothetical protein
MERLSVISPASGEAGSFKISSRAMVSALPWRVRLKAASLPVSAARAAASSATVSQIMAPR